MHEPILTGARRAWSAALALRNVEFGTPRPCRPQLKRGFVR
jgi:hypothetical protein